MGEGIIVYTLPTMLTAELTGVEVSAVNSKMRPYCGVQMSHGSKKVRLNLLQVYQICYKCIFVENMSRFCC